jgi:hypothetical protein
LEQFKSGFTVTYTLESEDGQTLNVRVPEADYTGYCILRDFMKERVLVEYDDETKHAGVDEPGDG